VQHVTIQLLAQIVKLDSFWLTQDSALHVQLDAQHVFKVQMEDQHAINAYLQLYLVLITSASYAIPVV
jgi:hypothetical protein